MADTVQPANCRGSGETDVATERRERFAEICATPKKDGETFANQQSESQKRVQ